MEYLYVISRYIRNYRYENIDLYDECIKISYLRKFLFPFLTIAK